LPLLGEVLLGLEISIRIGKARGSVRTPTLGFGGFPEALAVLNLASAGGAGVHSAAGLRISSRV